MQTAEEIDPDEIAYQFEAAVLASDLGYDELAIGKFAELMKDSEFRVDRNYRYAVGNYAISLRRLGFGDQAITEYKESIRLNPGDEQLMFAFISELAADGDHEEMISEYQQYSRQYGYSSELHYLLCWESLALRKRDYGRQCMLELINHPKATLEKRVSASRVLKGIAQPGDVPAWKATGKGNGG